MKGLSATSVSYARNATDLSHILRQPCRRMCDKHAPADGLDSAAVASEEASGATTEPDASLAERVAAGDKRALARAISLVEKRDAEGDRLVAELFPRTGKARIVGVTGPPGVGKSTLIGALTAELRKAERDVGVLSIDPSSPFTQGAMLGDRIRLADHFLDPGAEGGDHGDPRRDRRQQGRSSTRGHDGPRGPVRPLTGAAA